MNLRKLLCALLAAALLLSALPAAMAAIVESGVFENGGSWTLDDQGVLTITGEANLSYARISYNTRQKAQKVVFGPSVEYDGGMFSYSYNLTAFEVDASNPYLSAQDGVLFNKDGTTLIECPTCKLGSYTVPSSVKVIAGNAFIGSYLSSISLPEGLETIEDQAFFNAEITSLTIPASVTYIEGGAFAGNSLESLQVAQGSANYRAENNMLIETAENTLVAVASSVTGDVVVPRVDYVAYRALSHVNSMNSITFQDGLREIGYSAFLGAKFKSIRLPASLECIQYGAFSECEALDTVIYDGTLAQWAEVITEGNDVLNMLTIHCSDGDTAPSSSEGWLGENVSYTLTPDGLLTISGAGEWNYETWFFEGNNHVKHAVLESGVTVIGYGGFANCSTLESVSIPDTVTVIHNNAFYGCDKLTELRIPVGVTVIEDEAFDASDRLNDIYYGGTVAQWRALIEASSHNDVGYITIHCSDDTIAGEPREDDDGEYCGPSARYLYQEDGDDYDLFIFGNGAINEYAFEGMLEGDSVRLYVQDGITEIREGAFRNVAGIYYVEMHDDLRYIGENAFEGTSIEKVRFIGTQEQWDAIQIGAGNDALLNAQIEIIGGSGGEEKYPCGDGLVYSIEDAVFGSNVERTLCTEGYGSIDAHFFENWEDLNNLVLTGVVKVGDYAFAGCSGVGIINLYEDLEEIGDHAFDNVSDGAHISYWGSQKQWDAIQIGEGNDCLFAGNLQIHGEDGPDEPDLDVTYLPNDLRAIEPYAFEGTNLQKVFVPEYCETIGDYAFANCSELRFIDLPNVSSIGEHAFDGCTGLTIYTLYGNGYVEQYAAEHGFACESVGE